MTNYCIATGQSLADLIFVAGMQEGKILKEKYKVKISELMSIHVQKNMKLFVILMIPKTCSCLLFVGENCKKILLANH